MLASPPELVEEVVRMAPLGLVLSDPTEELLSALGTAGALSTWAKARILAGLLVRSDEGGRRESCRREGSANWRAST